MKARPILMHGRSIRNLLAGRKTQTRRIVKPQPARENVTASCARDGVCYLGALGYAAVGDTWKCPYGKAGDLLYVREEFSGPHVMEAQDGLPSVPPSKWPPDTEILYWADGGPEWGDWTKPKPSIHMPRWASRLTLHLTDVYVERVQEISADDAIGEGCDAPMPEPGPQAIAQWREKIRRDFQVLWNDTNGPDAWDRNDWVWVLCFDVIEANVDDVISDQRAGRPASTEPRPVE